MSNIYIQEPPTNGKICFETTVGDIEIELWSKECPKACRNFVQLCMEKYYDGTIFHRVVPGFVVQGGDPTGSGFGGESIYGAPFKDEFHSRLRFVRRGLVAMANGGKTDDNGSQFFFTLDKTPEFQNKNTVFGQVVGNTLFNMLKLAEGEIDKNDRPIYPHKILRTNVISNPFSDIIPRIQNKKKIDEKPAEEKSSSIATKNFNLLSFGDEAEEDEELNVNINKAFSNKGKSSFDHRKAEHTSKDDIVDDRQETVRESPWADSEKVNSSLEPEKNSELLEKVKAKLKANKEAKEKSKSKPKIDDEDVDLHDLLDSEKQQLEQNKLDAFKEEFKTLKKSMKTAKTEIQEQKEADSKDVNPELKGFLDEVHKYDNKKGLKKSSERAADVYERLRAFKDKISASRTEGHDQDIQEKSKSPLFPMMDADGDDDEEDLNLSQVLATRFIVAGENEPIKDAVDVHVKNEERFDLSDPRHPTNKRRRGEIREKRDKRDNDRDRHRDEKRSRR